MAEIIGLDNTPLGRLQKKHAEEIAAKDAEIAELKVQAASVRGVNEMLKFELLELESLVNQMQKQFDKVLEHVQSLKNGLPTIEKGT